MRTRSMHVSWIMLVLAYILISCTRKLEPELLITPTLSPSSGFVSQITTPLYASQTNSVEPSVTVIPTQKPKQTEIMTNTPRTWPSVPTLSSEDSQKILNDLLVNNAGCRLPCFWGITPGETSFEDVLDSLEPFTMILGVTEVPGNIRVLYSRVPFPEEWGAVVHSYTFINNVVEEIHAYNYDFAPGFYLSAFLETYGQPSEIWVSTFREEEQSSRPFLVDLFYPDQGILMEYSGGEITDLGYSLKNCLYQLNSPFIYLWVPEQGFTFQEATERFLDSGEFKRIPLVEATGIDENAFYSGFQDFGYLCLETPKDLWP